MKIAAVVTIGIIWAEFVVFGYFAVRDDDRIFPMAAIIVGTLTVVILDAAAVFVEMV